MRRMLCLASAALWLAAVTACADVTQPAFDGGYEGSILSANAQEGAALFTLSRRGLVSLSAPGRILVARKAGADSIRVMIINDPRVAIAGPITFVARMEDGLAPPAGRVLLAAAPDNERRPMDGYGIGFVRAEPSAIRVSEARITAAWDGVKVVEDESAITFARATGEFLDGARVLSTAERRALDREGNADGGYDLGDLRLFLARNRTQIPTTSSWIP